MERYLAYIWKYRLYDSLPLRTSEGTLVEVLDPGIENIGSGPDFFNAKIRLGETLWAGNVEIHTRSSHWKLHAHESDKAYESVVLHVVSEADCPVMDHAGRTIPQVIIPLPESMIREMDYLLSHDRLVQCYERLNEVDHFRLESWKSRLLIERLEQKTEQLITPFQQDHCSWDEAFYRILARSFGFGSNADPMEWVARSLPLSVIHKHANSPMQIEALFLGQGGFLEDARITEEYPLKLREEYRFLKHKYTLPTIQPIWNMRVNKGNLPTLRLAQLACLIGQTTGLVARLLETSSIDSLQSILRVTPHAFWDRHYTLNSLSEENQPKTIGENSLELLIINAVVPLLFAMGKSLDDEQLCERGIFFLEQLKAENNAIVRQWMESPVTIRNASDSQAILQLHKRYCSTRDCFRCQIGHALLKKQYQKICEPLFYPT